MKYIVLTRELSDKTRYNERIRVADIESWSEYPSNQNGSTERHTSLRTASAVVMRIIEPPEHVDALVKLAGGEILEVPEDEPPMPGELELEELWRSLGGEEKLQVQFGRGDFTGTWEELFKLQYAGLVKSDGDICCSAGHVAYGLRQVFPETTTDPMRLPCRCGQCGDEEITDHDPREHYYTVIRWFTQPRLVARARARQAVADLQTRAKLMQERDEARAMVQRLVDSFKLDPSLKQETLEWLKRDVS